MLQPDAYETLRDSRNPFVDGLYLIVVVGLVIAVVNLVGTVVEWAAIPDLRAIQQQVLDGLRQMPWYQQFIAPYPEAVQRFEFQYDLGWKIFPRLFGAPDPTSALVGLVGRPLILIVSWLVFGLLAHLFARLLGGVGTLAETMGSTALAVAPQLWNLTLLLPFAAVGGVVGTWTLLCRYKALRTAHGMSWERTLLATILPLIILWLFAIVVGILSVAIFSTVISTQLGGQ
ncbi:MAG TPA: hypothetical protein EYH31_03685 [Anaerolineae bacterium]|nr:hypothetical protein [Anaerolineae bacterium]